MRALLPNLIAAPACLALALTAGWGGTRDSETQSVVPFVPAVSMDQDRRVTPEQFAVRLGLGEEGLRERIGASGLIRCGNATGTGQLTLRGDVITTAAHVLMDSYGKRRVGCVFEPLMGEGPVPLEFDSIRTGSTMPLNEPATRDWAVARLVAHVPNATPYGVAASGARPKTVLMCAGGNRQDKAIGTEQCSLRGVIRTARDGVSEVMIDCNAGPGSSGAALVSANKVVGIYVGYRSSDPSAAQKFSSTHYNFAITVDGPFRRALQSAANR